jgi:4-amino-4-deoxy-L-arabinose transferase-like glycosyltransferase
MRPSIPWLRRSALLDERVRIPLSLTLFVVLSRLPVLLAPKALDDEQVYAVVARQMLAGGKLYIDAIERKPPLLFLVYQAILGTAGAGNWFALHLAAVLWTLATMAGLYLIARRLFHPSTGIWAALLYILFHAWGDYRNLALNGELMMNLPIVLAFVVTLGPSTSRLRPELTVAGALVAIGFMLKQPAGIAGLPLGLYVLHPRYRASRGIGWRHSLGHGLLLLLGFVAVFAITGCWLWQQGILREALRWTILDHAEAPAGTGLSLFLRRAPDAVGFFVLSTLPLLLGTGRSLMAGVRGSGHWGRIRAEFFALLLLLGVSLVGVSINGQFLYHYFLQLLPPLALLAAPAFDAAWAGQSTGGFGLPGRPWLGRWLGMSALIFLAVDSAGVMKHRALSVAATYVREHSEPADRIFVWGQGTRYTGMYLDADRLPATRFIASFPLTGHVFGLGDPDGTASLRVPPERWQELREDLTRHPPKYIIDTDGVGVPARYPIARYPILREYLAASYVVVFRAPDGVVYERLHGG